jgi:hypothetical protein
MRTVVPAASWPTGFDTGMHKPMIGPRTNAKARPGSHNKRGWANATTGTSAQSGNPQTHRGANNKTVANHQRSPAQ